jgi:hypothetical protein
MYRVYIYNMYIYIMHTGALVKSFLQCFERFITSHRGSDLPLCGLRWWGGAVGLSIRSRLWVLGGVGDEGAGVGVGDVVHVAYVVYNISAS